MYRWKNLRISIVFPCICFFVHRSEISARSKVVEAQDLICCCGLGKVLKLVCLTSNNACGKTSLYQKIKMKQVTINQSIKSNQMYFPAIIPQVTWVYFTWHITYSKSLDIWETITFYLIFLFLFLAKWCFLWVNRQSYCIYVKRVTLCNCLCSSPSSSRYFSASLIRNIGEFGATNYFTDH